MFLFSNYGERYPDRNKLFNAEDPITIHDMHFPGFHPGTTKFLIEKRNIRGVGTDTPSVDSGGGIRGSFGTHVALAAANLIGVEFTANLDQVPAAGAHVIISPMKIQSGSGAPSQIWAILPWYLVACRYNSSYFTHFFRFWWLWRQCCLESIHARLFFQITPKWRFFCGFDFLSGKCSDKLTLRLWSKKKVSSVSFENTTIQAATFRVLSSAAAIFIRKERKTVIVTKDTEHSWWRSCEGRWITWEKNRKISAW